LNRLRQLTRDVGLRNDKGKDGDQDWKALVEAANNEAWDQFGRLL
jgi:hypothetical protein